MLQIKMNMLLLMAFVNTFVIYICLVAKLFLDTAMRFVMPLYYMQVIVLLYNTLLYM